MHRKSSEHLSNSEVTSPIEDRGITVLILIIHIIVIIQIDISRINSLENMSIEPITIKYVILTLKNTNITLKVINVSSMSADGGLNQRKLTLSSVYSSSEGLDLLFDTGHGCRAYAKVIVLPTRVHGAHKVERSRTNRGILHQEDSIQIIISLCLITNSILHRSSIIEDTSRKTDQDLDGVTHPDTIRLIVYYPVGDTWVRHVGRVRCRKGRCILKIENLTEGGDLLIFRKNIHHSHTTAGHASCFRVRYCDSTLEDDPLVQRLDFDAIARSSERLHRRFHRLH